MVETKVLLICYNHIPPYVFSAAEILTNNIDVCPECLDDNNMISVLTDLSVEEYKDYINTQRELDSEHSSSI